MDENVNDGTVVVDKEQAFDMDRYICSLLSAEPFFAEISRHVDKRASTAISTAGVRIDKHGQFEMLYNPAFFDTLTPDHRRGVLKHEFYHLVFGHVTDRMPGGKMSKQWNIATDLAINSHIPNELPDMACFPGKGMFEDMPSGEAAEWYYNKLSEKMKEGGEGEGEPMDDHSGWGENIDKLDPSLREVAKERLREMMRNAAEQANKSSSGWGSIPQNIRRDILDRISGKIDWRAVLRYFIKTSQRSTKTSTVKRLNKRYAYVHPGQKVLRHAKIAVSIDQSGSVDDAMLEAFFAELNTLAKIATFTVIPFDTEVEDSLVYVWKKGKSYTKQRVKYGGTNFDAPTNYVNGKNFDGHIILTDMQAEKPVASKCQRMWMTTRACKDNMYFKTLERVIAVD